MTTHANQLDIPLDGARCATQPGSSTSSRGGPTCREVVDRRGTHNTRQIWKEPVGVVGAIVPWNFPIEVHARTSSGRPWPPATRSMFKPAPDTPWNATRLGRLVAEQTDFPPGVLNVVTSSDHLVGEELTLSPKVDLISFTGSTAVGKRIMEKGGATFKRVFLELGGKSATIVLDDADFATSVPSGIAVCFHAGQGCAIQTRMLLPRSRYEEGVEILKATLSSVAYGDPQRPDVLMGPLISAKQRDRVLGYISKGVDGGGDARPRRRTAGQPPEGWYVEPTLFTDVDNAMTIAQEEIFGPVLVAIPFDDDDDAVRIANDSVYGLSGGVFSGSLERSLAVAERIRTGRSPSTGACRSVRPTCPSAGTSTAASAARTASPASTSTSRPSRWRGRRRSSPGPSRSRERAEPVLRDHGYHSLRVARVVPETHDACSFVLDVPDDLAETFRYRPGQFCTFRVRRRRRRAAALVLHVQRSRDRHATSPSRSSAWQGARLQLVPRPRLGTGDTIELTKPAGVFCPQDSERPVVAFCGGSGITPVMSITKHVLADDATPVRLLYANRDRDSVIFDAALERLEAAHPGRLEVRHHFDTDGGFLTRGHRCFVGATSRRTSTSAGPGPFMDLVEVARCRRWASPPERIFVERFLVEQTEKRTR